MSTVKEEVSRTKNLDQNFIKRLWDPNRQTIPDWQDSTKVATHKLGYLTTDDGYDIIYPEIQEVNGNLIDYTNPKNKEVGYKLAIQRGDTIHVPAGMGREFTTTYKEYYPYFDYVR